MARRRYQNGSLKLVGSNRKKWVLVWREDVVQSDRTIARIQRRTTLGHLEDIPTKKLARRLADETLGRVNATDYKPSRPVMFKEFAEQWKTTKLPALKPSTRKHSLGNLTRYLLPAFGDMKLSEINQEAVQKMVTAMATSVRKHTTMNALATLSSIVKLAKSWGYDTGSWRCKFLAFPQEPVSTRNRVFTPDEAKRIIEAAPQPWKAMFAIAASCGLRGGELCALTVDDVDMRSRLIHVRNSVWYGHIAPPKTERSIRTVPMSDKLHAILVDHMVKTWKPNPFRLVFCTRRGTVLNPERVVVRHLQPLLKKLGIERRGMHAFRHTTASVFVLAGAPITVTQAQLGHTDPRVTLGIYSHVLGNSHREVAEKVADILL